MKNPNTNRVKRIRKAIKGYDGEFHDLRANVVDVLVDLRHLCDAKGIDFEKADSLALNHYVLENADEED